MSTFKPAELERLLEQKFGFREAEGRAIDHRWYELKLEGLPPIITKVSHSKKDVGDKLVGRMAKQLRVRRPFFDGMMHCTHSREDYHRQVRQDPFPPWHILIV